MSSHRGDPDSVQDQSIEICGRQSGTGRDFSPIRIILSVLQTHLHLHIVPTRKDKGATPRTFAKANVLAEIAEHWTENFTFILVSKG